MTALGDCFLVRPTVVGEIDPELNSVWCTHGRTTNIKNIFCVEVNWALKCDREGSLFVSRASGSHRKFANAQ